MFENRKLHLIIMSAVYLLSAVIIFVVAKVNSNKDILQTGYLVAAISCVLLVFSRLSLINRLLGNGGLNPRDYKNTIQYKNVRVENYVSLLFAALFIGLAYLLSLAI